MNRFFRRVSLILKVFMGDPLSKYSARYKSLKWLVDRSGFRLYDRGLAWPMDPDFLGIWHTFPENERVKRLIQDKLFTLYYLARSVQHIPGDIAECGVWRGYSSFAIASALKNTPKHLHGFDSFEGLSHPAIEDRVNEDHMYKWKRHDLAVEQAVAEKNLQSIKEMVSLYKGWIPERFSEVAEKTFCFVHIDVDLYQPTKESVEFFYERLSPGGVLICDDYGASICPGAKQAMDEFAEKIGRVVWHLPTGQGVLFK